MACCHPCIDNPYWVRNEDSGAAGDSSSNHRLDGGELFGCARATNCRTFEEGAGPLVPVVIDKIGNAYAEKGAIKARVETCHALSLDDAANGIMNSRLSALGFDLCPGGERDKWICQGHREKTPTSAGEGMGYIITKLGRCRGLSHCFFVGSRGLRHFCSRVRWIRCSVAAKCELMPRGGCRYFIAACRGALRH